MKHWILLCLIVAVHSVNQICPDRSISCPDSSTCCQLPDTTYGCCPLQNAVCCNDHIHCCPENTKCETGICIQLHGTNVTAKKVFVAKNRDIVCPDFKHLCPDYMTCCKRNVPDTYSCCPLEHAVCCSDGYHCCPEGTRCDVRAGMCVGKGFISEMYDSQKDTSYRFGFTKYSHLGESKNITSVVCPGSTFQCPNGYTCCQLLSGNWGCCPFTKATCCPDHVHCCPENMQCDLTSQSCSRGLISVPSVLKTMAKSVIGSITCPDNSTCSESSTCCQLNNKHYGCCPYPNAMCCSDHEHCCPDGYICDVEQRACLPKQKELYNIVSKYVKKLG